MTPDFAAAFGRTAQAAARYGLAVEIADVLDPNTGDLDGRTILIDHLLSDEDRLFILVHLFGHCVQWNVSPEARTIGLDSFLPKTAEDFEAVRLYERDASAFGITLLHEAGVTDLDQWLTDLWHADWLFLQHFYRTGERLDPRSLLQPGITPTLPPLPIPVFEPKIWPKRYAF